MRKRLSVRGCGILEVSHCFLGYVDELHYFIAVIGCRRIVVGRVALSLHFNEGLPETLYLPRKFLHDGFVVALLFGVSVFQSAVRLPPGRLAGVDPASMSAPQRAMVWNKA